MRVVQIGLDQTPERGGTTTSAADFRRALDAPVISFSDPLHTGVHRDGVVHVPAVHFPIARQYRCPSRHGLRRAKELAAAADLIIVHELFRHHVHWAMEVARANGIPYWAVPHGILDPWVFSYRRLPKVAWMRMIGREYVSRAARVLFATRREAEKACSHVPGIRPEVLYWPVEAVLPDDDGRARGRQKLGIPNQHRLLLFLGRLHVTKGVLDIIHALIAADDNRLHVAIAGPDGGVLADATTLAQRANGKVHIVGPVHGREKAELLAAADGYISLSRKENFGYAIAEAMLAGLPLILSPGNDIATEIEGLRCAWHLPDFGPDTAAAAMREFVTMPTFRLREMGGRARAWSHANLRFETFRSRLHALAEETINEHRHRRDRS